MLLLNVTLAFADGDHQNEIEEGKELVENKISCDKLNDEQLEAIGEYYMEQMHPGESHEAMHEMMGIEEGTEYHKQFHVNMAKRMYCGQGGMMGSGGMMGMMNMMGGGMMGGQTPQTSVMQGMMGGNMMNNVGYGMIGNNPVGFGYSWGFWNVIWLLFWIGIIVLIIWLIYKFIIKREVVSETPLEILKKRYAKGEITKKQFDDVKNHPSKIGGMI